MRFSLWLIPLVLALTAGGCASGKGKGAQPSSGQTDSRDLIVTPANVLSGRVLRSNPNMGFVVLVFPLGQMPALEQRMTVYRSGMKAGEVRIAGPQRDDKIVADLIAGEAAEGDEVRSP